MKRLSHILIAVGLALTLVAAPAFAEDSTSTIATMQQLIKTLQAQVALLQTQIAEFNKIKSEVKETTQDIKTTLRLMNQLKVGMTGDDVKLLQEILATDPEIYPEGLITGYYGKLTEQAVKRFQKKAGLDQAGVVGPKTFAKINELLQEGAGSSGKVPPGLLIAPGIIKKLGYTPTPPEGQVLPPGIAKKIATSTTSTVDVIPPVISELIATSTIATSTNITWITNEKANSKVWYSTSTPLVISTSTLNVVSSDLVLSHSLSITGLTASTTYYYLVTSADAKGNTATSSEKSFITLGQAL